MKRLFITVVIFILGLLCLTSCSGQKGNENSEALAQTAVKEAVIRFQEGDSDYILRIMGLNQAPFVTYCSQEQIDRIADALFGRLEGKIVSAKKKNDNTVLVETKLKTTDYRSLTQDLIQNTANLSFSALFSSEGTELTVLPEQILTAMEELASDCKETTEQTLSITVKKQGGGWEILGTDELKDAFSGGLYSEFLEMINTQS